MRNENFEDDVTIVRATPHPKAASVAEVAYVIIARELQMVYGSAWPIAQGTHEAKELRNFHFVVPGVGLRVETQRKASNLPIA